MKTTKWLRLATALILPLVSAYAQTAGPEPANEAARPPNAATAPADLAPNTAEVMRLAEAGTSDDVIIAYIQNSGSAFSLNADQILYLRDLGLSSPVITAMLNRDNTLRNQGQNYSYDQKLYAPSAQPSPQQQVAPVVTPPATPEAQPPPQTEPASAAGAAPVYVSSPPAEVTYFYNDLAPYGTWVQLEGVGWCWQPRVVVINRAWQPYCDSGHWVYTDAGWFWASDYSWGWAPFHYGRWHLHPGCGWVWAPDRVWAPAWVVWRSEGDYCGWAPLPPHAEFVAGFGWRFNGISVGFNFDFGLHPEHFTFIALHDFHQHDFAHRRLPRTEVTKIYNHTTIINNYTVNNKTVVNQGIKVERVAAATHSTIRPVHLRDAPAETARSLNGHATQKGDLMVYRPALKAPVKPVTMVAQKVDERHPVIQHQSIALARPDRSANVGGNAWAPAPGHRNLQTQPAGNNRPNPNNPPSSSRMRPAPNSYPAAPASPGTGRNLQSSAGSTSAPRESAAREGVPGSAASETPRQTPAQVQVPARENSSRPESNSQLYPLRSGGQSSPKYGRQNTTEENPGNYYPKSYHQASEAHAFPAGNAQQNERYSRPSGAERGQSRKKEQ